ncbi:hypothetical protein Tco_0778083 [Tanacetum coccineum]
MINKKDSEIVKAKGESRSLALKAMKESSNEECLTCESEDIVCNDEAEMTRTAKVIGSTLDAVDPNHIIRECPKPLKEKNQRAFDGVTMEYLVKISKKARILELKQRHLKKLTLASYTPYPSRKIRRICAGTSQEITKIQSNGKNVYELKGKFHDDLIQNAFSGTNKEDANDDQEGFVDEGFSDVEEAINDDE